MYYYDDRFSQEKQGTTKCGSVLQVNGVMYYLDGVYLIKTPRDENRETGGLFFGWHLLMGTGKTRDESTDDPA